MEVGHWHQVPKNRILLENYCLPGDLEAQIQAFVAEYNHPWCHEGIGDLTPADFYFGRGQTILIERSALFQPFDSLPEIFGLATGLAEEWPAGFGLLLHKRDGVGADIGPPHLADVGAPLGRKQKQPERSSLFGSDRPSSLE